MSKQSISSIRRNKQARYHSTGFPNWGQLVGGGQFGQNGQKLHENYKIGIFGSKFFGGGAWGGDKPIFRVVGGGDPGIPPD